MSILYPTPNQYGQSLLEVIVAVAIFSLMAGSLVSLVTGGFAGLQKGDEYLQAEFLAEEGIEGVRGIRDDAFNELVYTTSSITVSGNKWILSGEGTTEQIGKFTRSISFEDICRDASDGIVTCPGAYTDIQSKQVVVQVSWQNGLGVINQVERSTILTNWASRDWLQTDWSGDAGQAIWSDVTRYEDDDGNIETNVVGEVSLATVAGGGCGVYSWPFTTAGDYTYDANAIEVTGGVAQLVATPGGVVSGDTSNGSFTLTQLPWVYTEWETSGGVTVTGNYQLLGGNSGPYVDIAIPGKKGQTLSGFWEQSFATTINNPTTATTTFDWVVSQFDSTKVTSYQLYVFIDTTPGVPTIGTEVWSSGEITSTTSWVSVPEIDIASQLGTAGTYYVKLVARAIFSGGGGANPGTLVAGFDNVQVHWQSAGGSSTYPTTRPTINPTTPAAPTTLDQWTSFTETATKNGGEIYYQLSHDNGSTWQYWNGATWTTAGATNYSTASTIHANVNSFPTSTTGIMFKAFLESDGSQAVQLDEVRIGWGEEVSGSGSGYQTNGWLQSSAFDMTDSSPVQFISWSETIPVCSPACAIRFQIRTAPDVSGIPGVWGSWYGVTGSGTYFTNASANRISADMNGNQWLQYRVELSGDGSATPILYDVTINYK